jgi:rhodanese-related sulfurtransferase
MAFKDYFKPISSWNPDQVRIFLKDKRPEDYNLIDVRQPSEYEKEHIPGARLIPLSGLQEIMGELDPKKPTIAY